MPADLFDRTPFLVVPHAVGFRLDVAEASRRRCVSPSIAHNERRWRKAGFTTSHTPGDEDFDRFYHEMYRPFVTARFGEGMLLRSHHQIRRLTHRGAIVWISPPDGARVAGVLVEDRPSWTWSAWAVRCRSRRCAGKAWRLPSTPPASSTRAEPGLATLRLGGSMPWLADGALRFKAGWGATAMALPRVNRRNLVAWSRPSPVAATLLALDPVLRHRGRHLAAVPADLAGRLAVPSLPWQAVPATACATSRTLRQALASR